MKDNSQNLTAAEIDKNLAELQEKIRVIRFGTTGSKAKNVKETGNIRREIARLETQKSKMKK